jgi:CheY-like chemotaxis protein
VIKVLIADDDPDIRMLMFMALRRADLDVHSVTDGTVALYRCQNERFDVAVLDVAMPVRSGLEVTRALRADRHTSGMGVVLASAFADPEDVERGRAAGADAYLSKPFELSVLTQTVLDLGQLVCV